MEADPAELRKLIAACNGTMSVGSGKASGENRAEIATEMALATALSKSGGCDRVTTALVSICGSQDMSINEYNVIVKTIMGKLPDDASFLMGVSADDTLQENIQVTMLIG